MVFCSIFALFSNLSNYLWCIIGDTDFFSMGFFGVVDCDFGGVVLQFAA